MIAVMRIWNEVRFAYKIEFLKLVMLLLLPDLLPVIQKLHNCNLSTAGQILQAASFKKMLVLLGAREE